MHRVSRIKDAHPHTSKVMETIFLDSLTTEMGYLLGFR